MGFHTQHFFDNDVKITDSVTLNAVAPTQFALVANEPQPNIMTINKRVDKIHIVFESLVAYNDPIVGADVDVFIYYANNQAVSFYEKLAFNSTNGRYSVVMDRFMGVKYVYLRQNAGTALKAQIVFE